MLWFAREQPHSCVALNMQGNHPADRSRDQRGVVMSFGMYLAGFVIVVLGLGYGAYLAHMPSQWIAVMVIVLVGLGILKAVTSTRQKDPN